MNILAFESSCDETSAAVVRVDADGRMHVLSNIVASQIDVHRLYGGVVPEIAGRAHIEAISSITTEALAEAGLGPRELDLVAVTAHPGLIGALLVAVNFAKSYAFAAGLPLVAVDHIQGHIAAAYLTDTPPKPPFVAMAVSGGHTAIYLAHSYTEYSLIGTTRDDAIGEAYDKIGRLLGIPYPAGAGFDRLAAEGLRLATGKEEGAYAAYRTSEAYRDRSMTLPSPALSDGSLDFSFSGLKTATINLLNRAKQTGEPVSAPYLAARYTYEATEAVAKKLDMALRAHPGLPLVVAGGVAANSHLRARLGELARAHGTTLHIPPLSLCADNAAMIAAQGYYDHLAGKHADTSLNASAADSIT